MFNRETVSLIADYLGIVASCMTFLGIGGLLSWSFLRRGTGQIADIAIDIFAYGLRLGVSLLLAVIFIAFGVWIVRELLPPLDALATDLLITARASLTYAELSGLYETLGWIIGIITALFLVPLYFLTMASIYTGSLEPWRRVLRVFQARSSRTEPTS